MKTLRWIYFLGLALPALLLFSVSAVTAQPAGTVIYVDQDAVGPAHDGLSWTTAYTTVQNALDWTNTHTTTTYEIWVAEGVYYPDEGGLHVDNALTETFLIAWNNVQLYGGFAATETARSQRAWTVHPTVLSGDIDHNDLNTDGNFVNEVYSDTVGSNAWHVMYLDGATNEPLTAETVIDGFTITAGKTNGVNDWNTYPWDTTLGGGFYCDGSGMDHECSPILSNLIICGNWADHEGGGLYSEGSNGGASNPFLAHVVFSGNKADFPGGGGMCSVGYNGTSSPQLMDVIFSENLAEWGGGMASLCYGQSVCNPLLKKVTFQANQATEIGGGLFNLVQGGTGNPVLVEVIFDGNQSYAGGGMTVEGPYGGLVSPLLLDVVFRNNRALGGGGMLIMDQGSNGSVGSGNLRSTLVGVAFLDNRAAQGGSLQEGGGAILDICTRSVCDLIVMDSIVVGNQTDGMGGGFYDYGHGRKTFVNVVFQGNWSAKNGGGFCVYDLQPGVGVTTLVNATFVGNFAAGQGGAIYNLAGQPILANSILWGNRAGKGDQIVNYLESSGYIPVVLSSDIEGGYTGTAVLNVDPQFVQPISATFAPTTTGDYHLRRGSPLINAGNNLSVTTATDLDGRPRVIDGRVDLGAYEYSPYMTVVKTGNGDGTVTSSPAGLSCGTACAYTFAPNAVVTLTAAPMLSSTFDGWVGMPAGTNPITLLMEEGANATAIFNLKVFTITAGSTAGGQILPGGAQTVTYGSRRVFAIWPATGYALVEVTADGVSVGRVDLYAFNNVTAGHTISATFVPISFTVTVTPGSLPADGLSTATVTVRATEPGGRVSFAGREVELSWGLGSDVSPVKGTLDENGAASWLYTAGALAGAEVITATLPDVGITHVATAGLELTAAPLQGRLTYERAADLVTYTFVLSNAGVEITQTHVVMTGSVPLHTELVTASTNLTFTAGGDYGVGYVALPEIAALGPGESAELRWTVRRLEPVADLVTQGHAQSDTAALRLISRWQAWRVLLTAVFKR